MKTLRLEVRQLAQGHGANTAQLGLQLVFSDSQVLTTGTPASDQKASGTDPRTVTGENYLPP